MNPENPALEKLSLPELLERLSDISTPTPVSYWPQTDAWWGMAGVLVIALLYFGWRFHRRWRRDAYRRAALAELTALKALVQQDDTAFEHGITRLLRRAALAVSPRREVASLYGEAWLTYLDRQMGGTEFTDGAGRVLLSAPYRREASQSIDARRNLLKLAQHWIEAHRSAGS
jgi:HEPN domain-containing protein